MLTLNSFKFFFSCFLSLSAVISFSQTLVTSNISKDTTWTATGSPYIITVGSLKINQGITLTIEPGVVIKIRISINIEGTLNAIGSETKPIIFTSLTDDKRGGDTNNDGNASMPRAGEWGNILVQASALSKFENCYFSYGGNSTSHGALAIRGTSSVKYCYFENQEAGLGLSITFFSKASIEKISFGPKELKGIGLSNTASVFADGAGAYTLPNYDELPFIIKNTITINDDEQIFAQPDQSFKIISGEAIIVRGLFEAVGTASKTIKFTSIKDDNISGETKMAMRVLPNLATFGKIFLFRKSVKGNLNIVHFNMEGTRLQKAL